MREYTCKKTFEYGTWGSFAAAFQMNVSCYLGHGEECKYEKTLIDAKTPIEEDCVHEKRFLRETCLG